MPTQGNISIFLSYVRADQPAVEDLYQRLHTAGFAPWMDVHALLPGEEWWPGIQRAIDAADFVIVCLSPHAASKRGIVQREQKRALDYAEGMLDDDIYLIPLRLAECDTPERLGKYQWVDYFRPDGWERLLAGLRIGIERRGLRMPMPGAPASSTDASSPAMSAPASGHAGPRTSSSTSHPTASISTPTSRPSPPSPLAPFRQALARRRLAVLWAALPFPPAADDANPVVTANTWRAAAAQLPGLALDLAGLPLVDILSLDPTSRPLDACDASGADAGGNANPSSPATVILAAGDLPTPGRHAVYQLAGDLASGTDLVLTRADIRRRCADPGARRWLLDPWRDVAAAVDAVVIAHADPAAAAFRAWWDEGLADALAGLALYAVGAPDAPWPRGVTVVAPDWAAFAAAWRDASGRGAPSMPPSTTLTPGQRRRLDQRLRELQAEHDTLSRRIQAIDTDIGRATDSLGKQVAEDRKADFVARRAAVAAEMDDLERQRDASPHDL